MNKLTREQFFSVSVMLFGLFFGAGNLIFPPLLGFRAGHLMWESLLFFSVTAVVFPIFGIVVVAKTRGLSNLGNRVSKWFSIAFTSAIYLSIGPGLGIPRAGSVPFEMAVRPYLPESFSVLTARLVYTFVFFLVAYIICLKPSKLVNRMGKFLTPTLLLLILFMFLGVLFKNPNQVGVATEEYLKMHRVTGFLEGYNTMDTVAALNFGLVISLAIRSFNVTDEKAVMKYTVKAGVIAGSLLFVVYAMLSYIGMTTAGLNQGATNGAVILTATTNYVFGKFGSILLASIFTLACLTTCVGLITSGSRYFAELTNDKINYNTWVVIWTVFSFVVANFGLDVILKFSVPVLIIIYPVSIVLILMGLTQKYFKFTRLSYRATNYVTVFISFVAALEIAKLPVPFVTTVLSKLPFWSLTLGWVVPTFTVLALTVLYSKVVNMKEVSTVEMA